MQCSECEALKAELAEFEEVSRELQIELERDLASMEKSEMNMRLSSERAKSDLDNLQVRWESLFFRFDCVRTQNESSQTDQNEQSVYNSKLREHTTTLGQMTRELDLTRTAEKALRSQLRDMELDNDDLEKSERFVFWHWWLNSVLISIIRAKDSSLQDFESRYGRAIERIAMLEEELVNKAALEEELQRLKDELRGMQSSILSCLGLADSLASRSRGRVGRNQNSTSYHLLSTTHSASHRISHYFEWIYLTYSLRYSRKCHTSKIRNHQFRSR